MITTEEGSSPLDYAQTESYGSCVIPQKRDLYRSLHRGDLNRFGQRQFYMSSKEIQETLYNTEQKKKQLVDSLVNGDEDDYDSEDEDMQDDDIVSGQPNLPINRTQELVQLEIQAVMKIKMMFFKWFEEQVQKTMNVFSGIAEGTAKPVSAPNEKSKELEYKIEIHDEKANVASIHSEESSESIMSCCEDLEIPNPQSHLMCLLCKQRGEYQMTGRLIPYKLNMYVHTSCALWTNEVFDVDDGQIVNFYQQQKKLIHQKCSICNDFGATLTCARAKGCNKHFHFPCAYRSGKVKFTRMKEVYCEQCNKARVSGPGSGSGGGIKQDQIQDELNMAIFPTEYIKKKRLYIVKNLEEVNQQEYENEETEQGQSKAGGKQTSQRGGKGGDQPSISATPKKKDAGSNNSVQGKEIDVDKWRPFYYDLFNRVGNLTVLSLRREVNQLIDIVSKDSTASGASSIQAYIQQQQQIHGCHQSDIQSRAGRHNSGSQSGNLMEELRQYLDIFNDYATIRIYWKFYSDKHQTKPSNGCKDPRQLERGYFLYINKTQKILELEKGDLNTVMEFCSRQIRQSQSLAALVSDSQRRLNSAENMRNRGDQQHLLPQDFFWQRLLDHFETQIPHFNLQNIEFCVEKLFGLAKYPINVWNQLELTNNDLKYNLNTQKSKLDFFLKSAISIINASSMQYVLLSQTAKPLTSQGQTQVATGGQAKRDQQSTVAESKEIDILQGKVLTLDGIFKRMVKVNNLERNELDQGPLKRSGYQNYGYHGRSHNIFANTDQKLNQLDQLSVNQVSTKHMDYNQLMIALGKGRKVDIGDHFKRLNELKKGGSGNATQDIQNALLAHHIDEKKRRKKAPDLAPQANQPGQGQDKELSSLLNQPNKVNKSNLPIAMQYRSSLQNPKKVEVGPSKIHRIGLFAQENLRPKDIVIEYVGEVIRNEVADNREKRYVDAGIGGCYMFRLDDQYIIDATFFGGKARYLNHSCDANCSAKVITVDGQKHIIIRAKKQIRAGEELTYNYNFDVEEDALSCFCGAPNCLGMY